MSNQSSISRFRPGFIPLLTVFACLLLLICIGPGSTQGLAAQVTLAWDANTDPAVAGYKLYYGTAPRTYGTPVDVGKVTQFTLTGIQEGVNAYFAVTAYDASRNESAFSTELKCFTLVPAPCVNGSISPSSAVVNSLGMSETFTITPAANYKVSAVTVDGASVGAVTSYTFSNVTANHTISAAFVANTTNSYTISASAGANGSISPSGSISVAKGSSKTFTITPAANYKVSAVTVDGASVGAVRSYTFSNITANHTISAAFVAVSSKSESLTSFNGYGKSDILWMNTSTGQICIWYMDGVTPIGEDFLPTVDDLNWTIEGVGDFNGDGKPDILWRHTSGIIYVWYMDGATRTGTDYLLTVADPNWTIVGVGDFNSNGKPDILWRNTSSGQNYVSYMNGVTVTGADSLPTIADPNWTI
jgi:hypothetical protein